MKTLNTRYLTLPAFVLMGLLVGCDGLSDANPTADDDAVETAAASIAGTFAEDTGGTLDQINDVLLLAAPAALTKTDDAYERSYDPATQTWTVVVERERGVPGDKRYARFDRTYQLQFLNAAGVPQQFYVTNQDTAHSVVFDILAGTGTFQTPYLSHELNALSGHWTVTNAHLSQVTVNGTYHREGVDTRTTLRRERTADHILDLTMTDLVVPRPERLPRTGPRHKLSKVISGTLAGTYHADVTVVRGEDVGETTVDRTFEITFQDGEATISFEGGATFPANAETGDLK